MTRENRTKTAGLFLGAGVGVFIDALIYGWTDIRLLLVGGLISAYWLTDRKPRAVQDRFWEM